MAAKILAFAGSTREGSFNKRLLTIAIEGATAAGAEVTRIDLRDFPMPLYDGDLEKREGIPEPAERFRKELLAHHALLIATPEYNGSLTGVLKNAIDWASRTKPGEAPLACFQGKIAALVSASPGAFGGVRSLIQLQTLMLRLQVMVIPESFSLPSAAGAFTEDGRLADEKRHAQAQSVGRALAALTSKLAS
jgi:NAD(P)H-dependent FMN reductase